METKHPPVTLALHDLSSFGRCALTVICPTLSAMGVQVCPVPTALLSTHTGGFEGFCFTDTTAFMENALDHFCSLGLSFDAVYSGFLGSGEQIKTVKAYFDTYPDAVKLVDPVLGDDGRLYATVTDELVRGMRSLCKQADLITPNLTEAAFLLGESPRETLSEGEKTDWLARLSEKKRSVVITGLPEHGITNLVYDHTTGETFSVSSPLAGECYPGTGDLFASVLLGALLNGKTLYDSVVKASSFTEQCIRETHASPADRRNGVNLETCLSSLCS